MKLEVPFTCACGVTIQIEIEVDGVDERGNIFKATKIDADCKDCYDQMVENGEADERCRMRTGYNYVEFDGLYKRFDYTAPKGCHVEWMDAEVVSEERDPEPVEMEVTL